MRTIGPKPVRRRLDPVSYEKLLRQVLRRDGWRCQSCGAMANLEVHHKEFRSHAGQDAEENLITLCATCHASVHAMPNKSFRLQRAFLIQLEGLVASENGQINLRYAKISLLRGY
jgi:HNH endonuclease